MNRSVIIYLCFLLGGITLSAQSGSGGNLITDTTNAVLLPTLGATWTFSVTDYTNFPRVEGDFEEISVVDTLTTNGHLKYVLSGNTLSDTCYYQGAKMFFWNESLERYVMHYDFSNRTSYDVEYVGPRSSDPVFATVFIDSVSVDTISGQAVRVQHVRVENNGSIEDDIGVEIYRTKIYEGIGNSNFDLTLFLGQGLVDVTRSKEALRCYQSDSVDLNFQGFPCDSTWLATSIVETASENVIVYPNPASGWVKVTGLEGRPTDYELYDLAGQILNRGRLTDDIIPINYSGVLLLKVRVGNHWIVRRIVSLR